MSGINLLPPELKLNKYAVKASKSLKQFALLSVVVLFIVTVGFLAISIFFSIQKKSLATSQEALIKDIKNFEQTEQKLVLMQDRLSGIQQIIASNSAREEIEALEIVAEKNPQNIRIDTVKLDVDKAVVSITAKSSSDLTVFYSLLANSNFKQISLDSFNYSSENGYKVGIAISK